jgi:hypothetical protein
MYVGMETATGAPGLSLIKLTLSQDLSVSPFSEDA